MLYLSLKAFHIMAVIAWMAGLFYLPRLYVYHADARPGSELSEILKVMERRLLKAIMTPAMFMSWAAGLILTTSFGVIDWTSDHWFHVKLILVISMSVFHLVLARWRKDFEADRNEHSARFFRIANEVPTILMIGIVVMVIIRPF